MTLNNTEAIQCILQRIVQLLENGNESAWAKFFLSASEKLVSDTENSDKTVRDLLAVYGGAGSFGDLILQTNDCFFPQENTELNILRTRLYKQLTDIVGRPGD